MTSEHTAAPAFKNAIFELARTLWSGATSGVQVSFGHPGIATLDDIVSIGDVDTSQVPGPYGVQRSRDETITLDVVFSVYRAGGPDQEQIVSDRAFELLGTLERHLRVDDTTVGGTVLYAFVSEIVTESSSDEQIITAGRLLTMIARITAAARIRTA